MCLTLHCARISFIKQQAAKYKPAGYQVWVLAHRILRSGDASSAVCDGYMSEQPSASCSLCSRLQLLIVMPGRLKSHAVAVVLWQFPAGTLLP